MKANVSKTLLWMFLLALVVGGLNIRGFEGPGPAPLPPYPPAEVPAL